MTIMLIAYVESHMFKMFPQFSDVLTLLPPLVRKLISNQPQLGIPLQQWQSLNETDLVKIPQNNNLDNETKHRQ